MTMITNGPKPSRRACAPTAVFSLLCVVATCSVLLLFIPIDTEIPEAEPISFAPVIGSVGEFPSESFEMPPDSGSGDEFPSESFEMPPDVPEVVTDGDSPPTLFETSATTCPYQSINSLKTNDWLKSQSKEDEILLRYFNGVCGGTYAEMGALNGITSSNSYVFQEAFGWHGLLVELTPSNFEDLVINRLNELAVVNAGVCDDPRLLHFTDQKGEGAGIWEFMNQALKDTWFEGMTEDDLSEVTCQPLQEIIDEHIVAAYEQYSSGIVYFDFFSLDVEGAELAVLKSLDFSRTGFGIILVEHNPDDYIQVKELLASHGYEFFREEGRSLWFKNSRFEEIYEDLSQEE